MSPRAFLAPAIVLLAASTSACGGEGGPRAKKTDGLAPTDAGIAVDQCQALSAYTFQTIYNGDFLDGLNPDATGWYVNYDAAIDGGTVASVEANHKPLPTKIPWRCPNAIPADAGASDYALNLQVSGLKPPLDTPPIGLLPDGSVPPKGGYGALIGCNLADDASQWDGVAFWIRRGDSAADGDVASAFVSLSDRNTKDPDPTTPNSIPCDQDADPITGSTVNQCDSFGMGVAFYAEWTFYALPFAKMRQRGFGKAVSQAVFMQDGVTHLLAMKFDFASGQDWNVWVDGMAFYRGPEAP